MMNSIARVPTNLPRRYMSQLCKHFEHKLPVTLGEAEGRILFPMGVCALQATNDAILMTAEAADQEGLERLQDVVARHLVRFAFREPVEVVWEAA
jgi:uncharacterized protein